MAKVLARVLVILLFLCHSAYGWQLIITSPDDLNREKYILLILTYAKKCVSTQWQIAPQGEGLEDYFNQATPDVLEKMQFKMLRDIAPTFLEMTIKHDGYDYTLYHCTGQHREQGRQVFEITL